MDINYFAPINPLSYGVVSANILLALHKLGHRVSLFTIGGVQCQTQEIASVAKECLNNAKQFNCYAPCVKIFHQNQLAERIGKGKYYGLPIFELDKFSDIEVCHLNSTDRLIAPSKWAEGVFHSNGLKPSLTDVVPFGVDTSIFRPIEIPQVTDTYQFFNIGKWEKRKGHDILPRLFSKAFTSKDDVRLVMATHNNFLSPDEVKKWHTIYEGCDLSSKIDINVGGFSSQSNINDLINNCDCGIFPSRAEGWNLPLMESMAVGKPVITTNFSAHTEFCTPENSFLVDIEETEKAFDGKWFFGQGEWASLDFDQEEQIIEHMRHCYRERPSNPTGIETAKRFSWENTAKRLLGVIG